MKKRMMVMVVMVALLFSLLSVMSVPASAATIAQVKNDYESYTDGDIGPLSLVKTFAGIDKAENVRIKYSFGKGYLCPTGGGEVASVVYKLDTNGKNVADLTLKMKAHFTSREGYSPEWLNAPVCNIEVSTDGKNYIRATKIDGERVKKAQYPEDLSSFKDVPVKEYQENLTSALKTKTANSIYVRVSWDVYDYPLFSSIHSIEIVAADADGADKTADSNTSTATTSKSQTTTSTTQNSSKVTVSDSSESQKVDTDSNDSSTIDKEDNSSKNDVSDSSETESDEDEVVDNNTKKNNSRTIILIVAVCAVFGLLIVAGVLLVKTGVISLNTKK